MIRMITIVGVLIAISAAAGLYKVKLRTVALADEVRQISREIARDQEAITVLRAEWSLLNQPDRLQALAEKHLNLMPVVNSQIVRVDGLSEFLHKDERIAPSAVTHTSTQY